MEETPNRAPTFGTCFAALALGLFPFFLILAIAAFFGANTVTANGQNVYGVTAVITGLILNVFFATVLAGVQKLGFIFLGLLRRRRQPVEA